VKEKFGTRAKLIEAGYRGHGPYVAFLFFRLVAPVAMLVVAWLVYRRISSDQPREIVAPFALTYAWILVAPWVFPWYTAIAWVALTQVPRNRMTRWLTIVTVLLALWHSSGGQENTVPVALNAPAHVTTVVGAGR